MRLLILGGTVFLGDAIARAALARGWEVTTFSRGRSGEPVPGAEALVGGRGTPSKVTVSFDLGSREAVDELIERAAAAGGRTGDTDDYPFMYQRQFDDPDGYHYSPFWMKPDAAPTA